jgi:hypothetical protein
VITKVIAAVAALAAGAAAFTSPALGCKGKTVLFQDNFAAPSPNWDMRPQIKIQNGAMQITPDPGRLAPTFYKARTFDRADICVDVIAPAGGDAADQGKPSLLFEGLGYDDVYFFYINVANQTAGIARLLKKKWLAPIPFRKADGIATGPGAKNTLRLTINGKYATAYINDVKFTDFLHNAHAGAGLAGLEVDGGKVAATWSFKNFKITDVP